MTDEEEGRMSTTMGTIYYHKNGDRVHVRWVTKNVRCTDTELLMYRRMKAMTTIMMMMMCISILDTYL